MKLYIIGIVLVIIGALLSLVAYYMQLQRKKKIMAIKDFSQMPKIEKSKALTLVRLVSLACYVIACIIMIISKKF